MNYYFKRNWKKMLPPVVLALLSSVIFTLWQLGLMRTFDAAARLDWEQFLFWAMVELVGIAMNYGVLILENLLEARAVRDLNNQVRHDLYLSLMDKSHAAYHSQDTGEYISWLTTNIKQMEHLAWDMSKCDAGSLWQLAATFPVARLIKARAEPNVTMRSRRRGSSS